MRSLPDAIARPGRRPGFTLIELLVVIAIIGVLSSLALTGVMKLRAAQVKRFTEITIDKVTHALDQQWKATLDDIKEDAPDLTRLSSAAQLAGLDPRRARVIYNKLRLKARFPTSFAEAREPDPLGTGPANGPGRLIPTEPIYLREFTINNDPERPSVNEAAVPADLQSSILLFLSLSQARRGMAAFNPSELDPTAIATVEIPLVAGGTKVMSYFKDSWDNPIRFYNFPTGNTELAEAPYVNPQETDLRRLKGRDPQDPEGTLYGAPAVWPAAARQGFIDRVHGLLPNTSNAPIAQYLIPVVASAGSDGVFGLSPSQPNMMAITDLNTAGDNIYSYRLRQAGARGD